MKELQSSELEGRIIFNNNCLSSNTTHQTTEDTNEQKDHFERKDVLLNRMLGLVNGFYWPKSMASVAYTTRQNDSTIVEEEPSQSKATISDLPTSVLLEIFSLMDVITLSRTARTCQTWYNIANDGLLWERKLQKDSQRWEMIDHLSHPNTYKELNSELTFKEIYLRCCPECRVKRNNKSSRMISIQRLGFYFGLTTPRIAMFGSGLDRNNFVKKLLWDKHSPFVVQKMFPGQFEGLGSGFTLSYSSGSIDLMTLYRMSKAEREQDNVENLVSKLLVPDPNNADDEEALTLSQPARQLCSSVNAFVYAVRADDIDKICFGSDELEAMLDERWSNRKIPLLVLCLKTNNSDSQSVVPSVVVAEKLNLRNLSRPWQVRQCNVDTLHGILPGVQWLNERIMTS